MDQMMQSRRRFLKVAGAAGLGTAALAAFGCTPAQTSSNDSATSVDDIEWDEEYDVVVAGGGLSGMTAALTVALEGEGKNCLLIEKGSSPMGNGNSQFSSGLVVYTSTPDKYLEYLKDLRGDMDNTPDDVLEAYAEGAGENLEWVKSLNYLNEEEFEPREEFAEMADDWNYNNWPEYPEFESGYSFGRFSFTAASDDGIGHIAQLVYKNLQDYTDVVTHKTDAPLTALVQDPDTKAILGCVYEEGGQSIYVRANSGVIMCTGGFENNSQMKQDYFGQHALRPLAGQCNEGDGHFIAMRAGADMWHMNSGALGWTSAGPIDGTTVGMTFPRQYGITVGKNGRRYMQDWSCGLGINYDDVHAGVELQSALGLRHGHIQFGGDWACLPMPEVSWTILDADGFDQTLNNTTMPNCLSSDPVGDGCAVTADSLEELAEVIGVPQDEFMNTISVWNDFCEGGADLAYYRPAYSLVPIATAPFYAVYCPPVLLNTDGGPRRSAKGEIIDVDGEPIPNLYSAGEFGSVWCHMYDGGGNLGECLIYGRISARNCMAAE